MRFYILLQFFHLGNRGIGFCGKALGVRGEHTLVLISLGLPVCIDFFLDDVANIQRPVLVEVAPVDGIQRVTITVAKIKLVWLFLPLRGSDRKLKLLCWSYGTLSPDLLLFQLALLRLI